MRKTELLTVMVSLAALVLTEPAWALGCNTNTGADYALLIDATSSCDSLSSNMSGCRIDGNSEIDEETGFFKCTDPVTDMTVLLTGGTIGGTTPLSWKLKNPLVDPQVDVVITGGANSGGTCGFFFTDGAVDGQNHGFTKDNGTTQKIPYAEFCTDGINKTPPLTKTLPPCPEDIQAALDNTDDYDYAAAGTIGDADAVTLCFRTGLVVQECVNEEQDSGDVLPPCSDGPDVDGDGLPDGPLPFISTSTTTVQKVGVSSCIYTCVPPPLTIGGRSQCGYICN